MTKDDLTQLNTRMPSTLKARIEESAKESKRSLNAEVIALLEEALGARAKKANLPPDAYAYLEHVERIFEDQARRLINEIKQEKPG